MHVESTGFRGFAAQNALLYCSCSTPHWDHRHHRALHVYMLTSELMWGASESLAHGSSGRTMDMMLRRGGGGGFCEQQGRRKIENRDFPQEKHKEEVHGYVRGVSPILCKTIAQHRWKISALTCFDVGRRCNVVFCVWRCVVRVSRGGVVALAITPREIPVSRSVRPPGFPETF